MLLKKLWIPAIMLGLAVACSSVSHSGESTQRITITTDSTYVGTWQSFNNAMQDDLYKLYCKKGVVVALHYRWQKSKETVELEGIFALREKKDSLGYVYVPLKEVENDEEEDKLAFYIEKSSGNLVVRDNFLYTTTTAYFPVSSIDYYVQSRVHYLNTCRQNDSLTYGRFLLPTSEWKSPEMHGLVRIYRAPGGTYRAVHYDIDTMKQTWDLIRLDVQTGEKVPVKNYFGMLDSCAVIARFQFVNPCFLGHTFIQLAGSDQLGDKEGDLLFMDESGRRKGTGAKLFAYDYSYQADSIFFTSDAR